MVVLTPLKKYPINNPKSESSNPYNPFLLMLKTPKKPCFNRLFSPGWWF
jgi:hypothetical protein